MLELFLDMPTTYAHWRFGKDCIDTLPSHLQDAINNHRELFDFGVHGPDIFFYDLAHKQLPKYGSAMHHKPSREFFERCIQVYKDNENDKEAMLSYILGFLSHFALDSQCHGYINRKNAVTKELSHNKIEAEYDAHLIRKDGHSISRFDRAQSLKARKKDAAVIARFFPFSANEIYRTCRMHHLIIHALNCRSDFKRGFATRLLEQLKMYDYRDLIVSKEENSLCKDSNLRLDKLKENALKIYPELVRQLMDAIENDAPLGSYFDRDFDPEDESIKVLPYEEELNYIPELN